MTQETIKQILRKLTIVEEPDLDERLNHTLNPASIEDILLAYIEEVERPNETWINAKTSSVIEFHLKHDEKKEDVPLKQQIPEAFHEFLDIFDETKADLFPKPCSWDHKIELKEGFQLNPTITIPYGFPVLLRQKKRHTFETANPRGGPRILRHF